ncbi:Lrp/AsnC family transcriptional regulator [Burkholderia cepacia]|uniref:Lrp/AsnC family transcriptional regulator n=1 Tax=Burkholderia cepacia TaxID=292 RepID=UPI00075B2DB1|nr:Lrp/AsnC family transcriptional regulator [Burkholderia cepacia]KVK98246.1 AsnC family transcriptional regulator [Burkholderia cepacia]
MKILRSAKLLFDDIDRRIISRLHNDSRTSVRALAAEVGLSAPSCSERLKRLEDCGVIQRFTIDFDAAPLGYTIQAIVRVKSLTGQFTLVEKLIKEIPECVTCFKVTGDDDFVCHFYLRSVTHLDEVLKRLHGKADTHTSIVKTVPLDRRLPPL